MESLWSGIVNQNLLPPPSYHISHRVQPAAANAQILLWMLRITINTCAVIQISRERRKCVSCTLGIWSITPMKQLGLDPTILMQVLREDAQERPTAAESLRHPLLRLHTAKQQVSEKADLALSPSAGSPSLRIRTPGVGTFTSPSHSLSPAMATWKIPARAGGKFHLPCTTWELSIW